MSKKIIINNCLQCPYYSEENNVLRNGYVGVSSKCKSQNNKEIGFTDKMDIPGVYNEVDKKCPLDNN